MGVLVGFGGWPVAVDCLVGMGVSGASGWIEDDRREKFKKIKMMARNTPR